MANISSYLAAILAAVYGEDVRGSIHDAIEIINDVSEVVLSTGTAVTGPTSSSTGYYEDSLYINTSTMELWKCTGTDTWQSLGVLKGADGSGIASIDKTSTVGLVDTYTITYDDGDTDTFNVTNGADGQNGSKWYKGTAITGTGTSITGFPGIKDDYYLNSSSGNIYVCTRSGGASVPDPAEWDYVMTLTGGGGSSVTVIDNLSSTSSTDALSANQGRVLNGYVSGKISNPATKSDGQVLTYDGLNDEWKAQNPSGGGHTMIDNSTYISSLTAKSADDTDDDVASGYAIANWSNADIMTIVATMDAGDDSVGTWETEQDWTRAGAPRTGWIWHKDLYHILQDNNVEIEILFDIKESEVVNLYAYRVDDEVQHNGVNGGAIAIKLNGAIQATTLKVAVNLKRQRTNKVNATIL